VEPCRSDVLSLFHYWCSGPAALGPAEVETAEEGVSPARPIAITGGPNHDVALFLALALAVLRHPSIAAAGGGAGGGE
jgi:hypothetical protein